MLRWIRVRDCHFHVIVFRPAARDLPLGLDFLHPMAAAQMLRVSEQLQVFVENFEQVGS